MSGPHQRGSKPRSKSQEQHAPVAEITAERLHGCVVNDAHRDSQRPRKIKMGPILTQMLRVSKNSSVTYRRRKTNRRNVEFPAPHGLLKFGEKLFWSHSWTGCKFAFHALRHEQFHEAAADIDDENSSLHERASARGTRTYRPRPNNRPMPAFGSGFAVVLPGQHSTISSATNRNSSCRADFKSSRRFFAICCTDRAPLNCEPNWASSEVSFNFWTRSKPSLV